MEVLKLQETLTVEPTAQRPACFGQEVHPSGMDACAQCPAARACYEAWERSLSPVVRPAANGTNGNGRA
jgi:hypothetical protein